MCRGSCAQVIELNGQRVGPVIGGFEDDDDDDDDDARPSRSSAAARTTDNDDALLDDALESTLYGMGEFLEVNKFCRCRIF